MTIYELADLLDVDLKVTRYPNQDGRWCAHIQGCEVLEGSMLVSKHGNGKTPELAIARYIEQIGGGRLVFAAALPDKRREFVAPKGMTC